MFHVRDFEIYFRKKAEIIKSNLELFTMIQWNRKCNGSEIMEINIPTILSVSALNEVLHKFKDLEKIFKINKELRNE